MIVTIVNNPKYYTIVTNSWRNYVTKFGKVKINEEILKTISHYKHILTLNQILFVSSWWWHHVISMEDNTESLSIRTRDVVLTKTHNWE